MFERLLLCDYAVADLSMANANVYYELGIRHATRPWSTVLLFREGFRLPFDVGPLRAQPYHIGPEEADHRRRTRDLDGMRAVRADLGDLDGRDAGLVVDLLRSFLAVEAYDDAVALVEAMPPIAGRTPVVREQFAFALNRLGRRDEAKDVLLQLAEERGTDSETNGLLGRVYKDQWADALAQGRTALAAGLLEKAIGAYLAGFEADWRDHYPGINAVQLMTVETELEEVANPTAG
jgi:hypothetical protein